MPPLHQVREINRFLNKLSAERGSFKKACDLSRMAAEMLNPPQANVWTQFLRRLLDAWMTESANAEVPVQDALEFLYEACSESRREFTYGQGVTLCTVHSAKGTEFDHVIVIGPWRLAPGRASQEEERRTLYVALTRARKTLAVFDRRDVRPSLPEELTAPSVVRSQFQNETPGQQDAALSYKVLSLEDINLGYPGLFSQNDRIHRALSALNAGDKLTMRATHGNAIGLFQSSDVCVARLSHKAEAEWMPRLSAIREVRVLAMVCRTADQDPDQTRRENYKVQEWELPIVEVVSADSSAH
jgi:ATP-dependent DNA helicase RecQ